MKNRLISHNRPSLDTEDGKAVEKAVLSGWVAEGSLSRQLEEEVSKSLGQKYAKVTSSGTAALHLALLALRLQKGDEVILPTYVCTALLNAVGYVGAKPVLVDIQDKTLCLSPKDVRKKITRKTKAIIVNHTFGFPAPILKIKSFGIPVIEDAAQALGTKLQGKPAGSFGDLVTCSFYATKMMTAGYGGMVLTSRPEYQKRILDLTHFDQRSDYKIRYNYALSDVSAALGLSQWKKMPGFVVRRRKIADLYQKALRDSPFYSWGEGEESSEPNYYRFLIGSLEPHATLTRFFKKSKIQTISPLAPFQLLHRYLGQNPKNFPVAETIARSVVSLPVYPSLKDSEISQIIHALKKTGT